MLSSYAYSTNSLNSWQGKNIIFTENIQILWPNIIEEELRSQRDFPCLTSRILCYTLHVQRRKEFAIIAKRICCGVHSILCIDIICFLSPLCRSFHILDWWEKSESYFYTIWHYHLFYTTLHSCALKYITMMNWHE